MLSDGHFKISVIPNGVREVRNPSLFVAPFTPELDGAPSFAPFAKGELLRSNITNALLLVCV
jgi:hypothetical protein